VRPRMLSSAAMETLRDARRQLFARFVAARFTRHAATGNLDGVRALSPLVAWERRQIGLSKAQAADAGDVVAFLVGADTVLAGLLLRAALRKGRRRVVEALLVAHPTALPVGVLATAYAQAIYRRDTMLVYVLAAHGVSFLTQIMVASDIEYLLEVLGWAPARYDRLAADVRNRLEPLSGQTRRHDDRAVMASVFRYAVQYDDRPLGQMALLEMTRTDTAAAAEMTLIDFPDSPLLVDVLEAAVGLRLNMIINNKLLVDVRTGAVVDDNDLPRSMQFRVDAIDAALRDRSFDVARLFAYAQRSLVLTTDPHAMLTPNVVAAFQATNIAALDDGTRPYQTRRELLGTLEPVAMTTNDAILEWMTTKQDPAVFASIDDPRYQPYIARKAVMFSRYGYDVKRLLREARVTRNVIEDDVLLFYENVLLPNVFRDLRVPRVYNERRAKRAFLETLLSVIDLLRIDTTTVSPKPTTSMLSLVQPRTLRLDRNGEHVVNTLLDGMVVLGFIRNDGYQSTDAGVFEIVEVFVDEDDDKIDVDFALSELQQFDVLQHSTLGPEFRTNVARKLRQ
jgi:hypothetical protein